MINTFAVILILNILLLPIASNSQTDDYNIENFFINEGFPVIRILDISQDKNGLIWLCSERQLHTFNGSQFELIMEYNKINFFPNNVLFDNNGNKWMMELSPFFSLKTKSILVALKIFDSNNKEIDIHEYLNVGVSKIENISQNAVGHIIFQANSNNYSFDQSTTKLNLPPTATSLLYSDENVVVVNNEESSSILDANTKITIHQFDKSQVNKVKEHAGSIYIQFTNGELYSYNIAKKESRQISKTLLNYEEVLSDFLFDNSGDLWIIKLRSLSRYNLTEKKDYEFSNGFKYPSLPYNTTAFKDREGNIWVGTNLGINKITKKQKVIFKNSEQFHFSTRNIYQINDAELFVSSYSGNYIYNLNSSTYEQITKPNIIFDMIEDDGFYYSFNVDNQLKKETLKPPKTIKQNQLEIKYRDGKYPGSMIKLSNDKKYLLLYHSVYEFDSELNYNIILEDKSKNIFYHNIYEINDKIYLLTNKGISVCDKNFTILKKLFSNRSIKLLHQDLKDKNILWLSTDFELIKYDIQTDSFKLYNSETGFINTNFTAITEDQKGNLWLPTFAGLNKFNKTTEKNQIYFVEEGLSNNEFNNNSNCILDDGRFIFGSISGFTIVDSGNTEEELLKYPNIQIHSCKMLSSNNATRIDLTEQVNRTATLNFKEKHIESNIQLSHHSYINLKSKLFKYRILKRDSPPNNEAWVNLVSNEIQVGRMPYGEYILQFQALNRSGNSVSDINQISVNFIKPFYKTIYVRVLGLLFFLLAIYFFFHQRGLALHQQKIALETEVNLRTQQIQKQKQELENLNNTKDKLFSILAHDLKSPLITLRNIAGKINYLIEKEQPGRIIEIGKAIEDKVSNLNIFLDNILSWAMQQRGHFSYKPKTLSIQSISAEILTLYQDLIQEKELNISEDIPVGSTCYADENALKTVIRNIIHNAIKYSPIQSTITIKYRRGEEFNILAISDLGNGIPQSIIDAIYKKEYIKNTEGTKGEKGTGLGFLISKELMDLNKGQLVFITKAGQGTTVELLLPISQ